MEPGEKTDFESQLKYETVVVGVALLERKRLVEVIGSFPAFSGSEIKVDHAYAFCECNDLFNDPFAITLPLVVLIHYDIMNFSGDSCEFGNCYQ